MDLEFESATASAGRGRLTLASVRSPRFVGAVVIVLGVGLLALTVIGLTSPR